MVTKEIKKNVRDCLDRYKKLKKIFSTFCDLCQEILSKDNYFAMSIKKIRDGRIEIGMLSTTLSLQFLLKKNKEDTLPIGCIDFYGHCESDLTWLWSLYFDEKGDVRETATTRFNSTNLLNTQGIEAFLYLILDKYMKHKCFEIKDQSYNLNFSDYPKTEDKNT